MSYFTKVMQQESSAEKELAAHLLEKHVGGDVRSCSTQSCCYQTLCTRAAASSPQTDTKRTRAAEARTELEKRAYQRHRAAKSVHQACLKLQACSTEVIDSKLTIHDADCRSIGTSCCHEKVITNADVLLQRPSATVLEAELAAAQRRVAHRQVQQQLESVELSARDRAVKMQSDQQQPCREVQLSEAGETHASLRSDAEYHHTKGETLAQLRAYAVEKIKQTQPSTRAPVDAPSASTAIAVLTTKQHRSSIGTLHYASSSDAKQHLYRQKALVAQQVAQAIKQQQQQL
jgi:hypothetical protein